jgi:hypothetical protein
MVMPLFEAEVFLDFLDEAGTNFLGTVIRKNGLPTVQVNAEVATFRGFENSALLGKPFTKFAVFHFLL